MSSIRRKPGTPFWYACYTLPDGIRAQRSTKTKDRKLALKLAFQLEEAARKRVTEAQARRVLSDIYEQIHGNPLDCPTVAAYAAQWLARKQGEIAAGTLLTYRHVAEDFSAYLGDRANQPLHHITPAHIIAWRDANAQKATPTTANNKLKVLRTVFQSAWREGLIADNPAAKVTTLKTSQSKRRAYTLDELKAVLRVASGEWKGMILMGLYTGQRLKDIASLTWANVDLQRSEIRLTTSKTGRHQVIPICMPLRSYLSELPSSDDPQAPLFPQAHPFSIRVSGSSVLSKQFFDILAAAGLVRPRPPKHISSGIGRDGARQQNELSFHSLRHTATSLLKATGASEAVARDIIGHESAEMSRHYTHVDDDAKRRALDNLPDLTR